MISFNILTIEHPSKSGVEWIDSQKVGLVINNDLRTYASIIAIWLMGKCYVPLHPQWPLERCLDIVGQVGLDTILGSSHDYLRNRTAFRNQFLSQRNAIT